MRAEARQRSVKRGDRGAVFKVVAWGAMFLIMAVPISDESDWPSDEAALEACSDALRLSSGDPSSALIPSAYYHSCDADFRCVTWGFGQGLRMVDEYGHSVDATAVCRIGQSGVVNLLSLNGRHLIVKAGWDIGTSTDSPVSAFHLRSPRGNQSKR